MNNYEPLDFTKLKPCNYNRKSSESEDKQMLSIISQNEEAQRIAEYYKLPSFVEIFKEAKSAKDEFARPDFIRMISLIKSGHIDTIVCWKLDRLARNMSEGGVIIDLLAKGTLKAIITHDKVYYPSDNVLLMSVEFGQGKQFVKDLSVNVKRGQTKKASMGTPHGVAALGFINDRTEEKGNRKWLPDQKRLDTIKILFDMYLSGTYSVGKIHRYAVNELKLDTIKRKRIGGKIITISRMYEILKDPIYAGFFYYGGDRYELDKTLPRLITEAQHDKIKTLMTRRNIAKIQHHQTAYSGFISSENGNFIGQDVKFQVICDCKHKFAYRNKTHCPKCNCEIENMENPKYLSYIWHYNVKNKKAGLEYKSISENKITSELIKLFSEHLTLSKDIIEWSKKYIHEMKEREISEKVLISERSNERKDELTEKKARLRAMFRDMQITETEYNEDLTRLTKEYADTSETKPQVDWYTRLMEIVDVIERMIIVLENGDTISKRKIFASLGSNLIWNDKELIINNAKEISKLMEGIKSVKSIYPKFEPKNYVVNKSSNRKNEPFEPAFSTLLPRLDSNQ